MPWYYYSGNVIRPIPIKRGVSAAVRPHSKVEIFEETPEVKALIGRQLLRRTGPPADRKGVPAREPKPTEGVELKDVLVKSNLAKNVAEKGVTTSGSLPPKKPVGKPEMTESETDGGSPEASVSTKKDKKVDKADMLSDETADSSKGEKKEEGQGRKRKYSRKKK